MNCRYVESRMAGYLDGELTGEEMLSIRSHLYECKRCCAEFDGYRRVKQMVCALPTREPNSDFEHRLLATVTSSTMSQPMLGIDSRAIKGVLFLAAASVLIVGFYFSRPSTKPDSSKVAFSSPIESDQAFVQASAPFTSGVAVSFGTGQKR